jgi:transmembrane sensor
MTQSNQGTDPQGTDELAAEWAVRLNERALTTDEQTELDQWLVADPRHRGALLRARAAWADLDRLAALSPRKRGPIASPHDEAPEQAQEDEDPLSQFMPAAMAASPPRNLSPAATGERGPIPGSTSSHSRRRFLIAAGLASVSLGGLGLWWIERPNRTYVSKLGEIRRVRLSDGSHMVLNTSSEATVRFDKTRREIELAGEGLFQVAKDPARPFIVRAGSVSVRAVGTVFSVRTVDQRVDVTVTEGVVELVDNGPYGSGVIRRVAANEQATIMDTRQVQVQSIHHDEAERQLAWRNGMVDFAGERLIDAVGEINRHNHRHIVVDDPALASRPVVGLFRANDPDGFAATVATALGAQSVELDDAIHLRLASAP